MQKTFEKHWTKADQALEAGNLPLARLWLKLTEKQLEQDNQYAHPAIVRAINNQIEIIDKQLAQPSLI